MTDGLDLVAERRAAAPPPAVPRDLRFDFATLRGLYRRGEVRPADIISLAYARIAEDARTGLWISLRERDEALELAHGLEPRDPQGLPLWGIPFSVKDNIDVAGLPTTAACPAFAYQPQRSARVVARLEAAGAICIGKTNLDQFATGLNGTRSPYGVCGSAWDADMVAGGSSSGSAVSVALQQVSFSVGTDTGGSGRIPAGLNGIVGLKPTRGTLSLDGIVPCCQSLDCPSVFALDIADAAEVAHLAHAPDLADPSLRDDMASAAFHLGAPDPDAHILVPEPGQREFFGNSEGAALYAAALARLAALGLACRSIDFAPFATVAAMVFDGPWIADRHAGIGGFVEDWPEAVLATTRDVIGKGRAFSAIDAFRAMEQLAAARAAVRPAFAAGGILAVPTVAPLYSIAEMLQEPVQRNSQHGYYSYFVNPMDLAAVSIPAGFYAGGMPFGITLIGPAFADARLAGLARRVLAAGAISPGKARP